jgi:hypothetical protein
MNSHRENRVGGAGTRPLRSCGFMNNPVGEDRVAPRGPMTSRRDRRVHDGPRARL